MQSDIKKLKEFYSSPSKVTSCKEIQMKGSSAKGTDTKGKTVVLAPIYAQNSSSDSDYMPGDRSSSQDDEEAKEILKKFKEFKKKLRSDQVAQLDDVFVEASKLKHVTSICLAWKMMAMRHLMLIVMMKIQWGEVEGSDVEVVRKDNKYPRFRKIDPIPKFALGMKFSGEKQFKKAIIKYGLAERRVINFIKDEADRLELLRSNPGSTVIVQVDNDPVRPVFERMYICLDALKKGFMVGCRKVIGLNGCFFKGATNGELLCALGRDANNQMYPIAWAVMEKETLQSWDWFFDLLCKDIKVGDGSGWVFISDQQKGLLTAVNKWPPEAEHKNCARHIYAH